MSEKGRGLHAKEIARITCETLQKEQQALILLWSFAKEGQVVVDAPPSSLEVDEAEWSPKWVKRFMWENRDSRSLVHPRAVLYAYNTGEGKVRLGLARLVSRRVAEAASLPFLELN